MCLLSTASRGFACACPDGMILDGDSNCVPDVGGTVRTFL